MRHVRFVVAAIAVLALILTAGFFWFAGRVPDEEVALDRDADGIVVLTGGAARINDAIELLASGRGKRLLISGVHPTTRSIELARLVPEYKRMFSCCIDLGHSAINTIGNAVETRHWARDRGFHSLVVVTSSYHMPRAMAELAHQLPDVTLIPFPVVPEKRRGEPWWSSAATTRLMVTEYLKYLLALVRTRLDWAAAEVAGEYPGGRG
ncbi:MAG: YdcF family protein [Bradyrhizobiaceae bacterium]|nr:YdcF family protein [Bradyrhizobiaceae bacterium]